MRLLLNLAHEKDFNLICIQNKVKKCIFLQVLFILSFVYLIALL